jgi:hypothetical protein
MNAEELLKKSAEDARKSVRLSEAEKGAMKAQLLKFMETHPVKQAWFASFAFTPSTIRYATLALFAVVLCGFAGVSYAAEGALPGDSLYPVKIQVNEKVLAWVTPPGSATANLQIQLADERMKELQIVSAKGNLNAATQQQVETAFKQNVTQAEIAIGEIHNPTLSSQLQTKLSVSVNDHATLLSGLFSKADHGEEAAAAGNNGHHAANASTMAKGKIVAEPSHATALGLSANTQPTISASGSIIATTSPDADEIHAQAGNNFSDDMNNIEKIMGSPLKDVLKK